MLDAVKHADAAQQVLVHRVVVVHVELHHRHDAAEIRHEAAKQARLVHAAQHHFGRVGGGEDRQEKLVRRRIVAQLVVHQLQRLGEEADRIGVEGEIVAVRQPEHADEIDRIAGEGLLVRDGDAVVIDLEVGALLEAAARFRAQLGDETVEDRSRLFVALFQLGAEDGGEVADILGDEKIVLHEALDVDQAVVIAVAEAGGELALQVEGQALFRAAGEEVQVAADRPEEGLAAPEHLRLATGEDALAGELLVGLHPVGVAGDPEEGVEVAQAPLAVLDVGLDEIAGLAGLAMPLVTLGELGGDEVRHGVLDHLGVEPALQFAEQFFIAEDVASLQQGGADGEVGARLADAFIHRAGGVADLQAHVPEAVEHGLGDALPPGGLLVGEEEEQIDVRPGRQHAAAIAAGGDDGHPLAGGRVLRGVELVGDPAIEGADHVVLEQRQGLGAGAAVDAGDEPFLGNLARLDQPLLEELDDLGPGLARAPGIHLHLRDVGGEHRRVEKRTARRSGARRTEGDGRIHGHLHGERDGGPYAHRAGEATRPASGLPGGLEPRGSSIGAGIMRAGE